VKTPNRVSGFPQSLTINLGFPKRAHLGILESHRVIEVHTEIHRMSENKFLGTRRAPAKKVLEATGYDVIVVERRSEALSIGVGYYAHIDSLDQPFVWMSSPARLVRFWRRSAPKKHADKPLHQSSAHNSQNEVEK
jgi:hypothetical protein